MSRSTNVKSKKPDPICKVCNKSFKRKTNRGAASYCSEPCVKEGVRLRQQKRHRERYAAKKAEALAAALEAEGKQIGTINPKFLTRGDAWMKLGNGCSLTSGAA